jgi:hypothetical protein
MNNHRWALQKKIKSVDVQLQDVLRDLKLYNEFIHKINIKCMIWNKIYMRRQYIVAVFNIG